MNYVLPILMLPNSDIFLLVEVADTTLYTDRKQKASIYAKAGIMEYWVLNVSKRQVYVFREPEGESYQQETLLNEAAILSPITFPEIVVPIHQLFSLKKRQLP